MSDIPRLVVEHRIRNPGSTLTKIGAFDPGCESIRVLAFVHETDVDGTRFNSQRPIRIEIDPHTGAIKVRAEVGGIVITPDAANQITIEPTP